MDELFCFLVILAILFVLANPWLLVAAGILLAGAILLSVLSNGGSSGGGRTYQSSSSGPGSSSISTPSEDGYLFRGSTPNGVVLATFRDGKVFDGYSSGLNLSFYQGSYSGGRIFRGASVVANYRDRYIYRGYSSSYSDILGRCENGRVYEGAAGTRPVASYSGDEEGAAAAAALFIFHT